ncbi:rhombosortase [Solemya velum gill symbiont]|nr:rhombosortase [Solemya velum gill symbiont]OOY54649.1 rhombosortase [Solemya velum gill symbiont]OOY55242.1 rhombosortase [Solemya velum gill symbiont]OOY59242.1 rhombosortase [Solemya velum gill symbiont]OOY60800.1 rhombosortase [Solemya velum gill symbiont]
MYELDLRYIASSVDKGVLWRLFSGHLIHGNWWHLALNAAGLVACLLLFRDLENPLLLLVLSLILAFLISAGLYYFYPHITWYLGFSGVLHGLFVIGAILELGLLGWAVLLIMTVKVGWEMTVGPIPGTESIIGTRTVDEVHLLGAVSGLVVGWITRAIKKT